MIKPILSKFLLAILAVAIGFSTVGAASVYAATTTWTAHPSSDDTQGWSALAWSPQLNIFVAVGSYAAMTSPDGVTWTSRITPDATHIWRGVAWSPELSLFVAVGNNSPSDTTTIMTSPDGINWTLRTAPNTLALRSIVWSPEQAKFVATSTSPSHLVSTDGITWAAEPGTSTTAPLGILWAAEDSQYVVASALVGGTLYTSPDGVVWTPRDVDLVSTDVAYSADKNIYVAVGSAGIMLSSDKGVSWTTQTSPVSNLRSVEWSPLSQEFVAVGPGGIVTSPDGIVWTVAPAPTSNAWTAITWSPALYRFTAVGNSGTNRTMVGIVTSVPSAPINLTATAGSAKVNLSWTAPFDGNSAITGYRIERSMNGGAFSVLAQNTNSTATTYDDMDVIAGDVYTYRVYALNAEGQSTASNDASASVQAMLADTGMNQSGLVVTALLLLSLGSAATLRNFFVQ